MKKKGIKIFFIVFLLVIFLFEAYSAFALEIIYPPVPGAKTPNEIQKEIEAKKLSETDALPYYFQYYFNLFILIGVLICLGALIYGGFLHLVSREKPETLLTARSWVSSALFGLTIITISTLIIYTVNPDLALFRLKRPVFAPAEIPTLPSEKPEATVYQEVPMGRLIDQTLSQLKKPDPTKTEQSLIDVLNSAKAKSEALKTKLEELATITEACTCGTTNCKGEGVLFGCKCIPEFGSNACENKCDEKKLKEIANKQAEVEKAMNELEIERIKIANLEVVYLTNHLNNLRKAQLYLTETDNIIDYSTFSYLQYLAGKAKQKIEIETEYGWPSSLWAEENVIDSATFYFPKANFQNQQVTKETVRLNSFLVLGNISPEEYNFVIQQIINEKLKGDFLKTISEEEWQEIIKEALEEGGLDYLKKTLEELAAKLAEKLTKLFQEKINDKVETAKKEDKCAKFIAAFEEFMEITPEKILLSATTTREFLTNSVLDQWAKWHESGKITKDVLNKDLLGIISKAGQEYLTTTTLNAILETVSLISPKYSQAISKTLSKRVFETFTEGSTTLAFAQKYLKEQAAGALSARNLGKKLGETAANWERKLIENNLIPLIPETTRVIPIIEEALSVGIDILQDITVAYFETYFDWYLGYYAAELESWLTPAMEFIRNLLNKTVKDVFYEVCQISVGKESTFNCRDFFENNLIQHFRTLCQNYLASPEGQKFLKDIDKEIENAQDEKTKQRLYAYKARLENNICSPFTTKFITWMPEEAEHFLTARILDLIKEYGGEEARKMLESSPLDAFPWLKYLKYTLYDLMLDPDLYQDEETKKSVRNTKEILETSLLTYLERTGYINKSLLELMPYSQTTIKDLLCQEEQRTQETEEQRKTRLDYCHTLFTSVRTLVSEHPIKIDETHSISITNDSILSIINTLRDLQQLNKLEKVLDLFPFNPIGHLVNLINQYLKDEDIPCFTKIIIRQIFPQSIPNFIGNETFSEKCYQLDNPFYPYLGEEKALNGLSLPLGLSQPELAYAISNPMWDVFLPEWLKNTLNKSLTEIFPFLGEPLTNSLSDVIKKCANAPDPAPGTTITSFTVIKETPNPIPDKPPIVGPVKIEISKDTRDKCKILNTSLVNLCIEYGEYEKDGKHFSCKEALGQSIKSWLEKKFNWLFSKKLMEYIFPDCWKRTYGDIFGLNKEEREKIADEVADQLLKEIDIANEIDKALQEKSDSIAGSIVDKLVAKIAEKTGQNLSQTKIKEITEEISKFIQGLSETALKDTIEKGMLLNSLKNL